MRRSSAVIGLVAGAAALTLVTRGVISPGRAGSMADELGHGGPRTAIRADLAPRPAIVHGEVGALVGLAAVVGVGVQVRHQLRLPGPDPAVVLRPVPQAAGALAGRVVSGIVPAWHSGASGDAAENGSFGKWRGEPLQIVGTWSDTSAQRQASVSSLDDFRNWNGDIDVAVGGLVPGESWAHAAAGAYLPRWTQSIRSVRAKRAGKPGTTYIRFAHEMTGDWFTWRVTPANVAAFRAAWRRFHELLVREYPQAKLVFSPNDGNHTGVALERIWPGDDVVDVVGPDSYDGHPNKTSQAQWDAALYATADGPKGLGAWRAFAAAHHKPMAIPEWGLRDRDNPFYIKKMHEFLASCAPKPGETDLSGKCIYDIYFNIADSGDDRFVIDGGPNRAAAAVYVALRWGSP